MFLSHHTCELYIITKVIYSIKNLTAVALQHEMLELKAQEFAGQALQERQYLLFEDAYGCLFERINW